MWTVFKALPTAIKLGWAIGLLLALSGIVGGAYYGGYTKGVSISALEIQKYKTKSSELQNKLDNATGKVDTRIVTKFIEKKVYIKEKAEQLDTLVETVYVPSAITTNAWVTGYNASILSEVPSTSELADNSPSNFSDKDTLKIAMANNKTCIGYKNNLESLQNLVNEREAEIEKINSNSSH